MLRTYSSRILLFSLIIGANLYCAPVFSSSNETGIPFFDVFTPDIYKAQSQNTDITQSSNGFIYIANQKGLLEYDGTSWHLSKHPYGMQPLSIDIDSLDQIFVGYDHDIGRMRVDSRGQLYFESFRPLLEDTTIVIDNVWSTLVTPDGVIFEDWENIFLWKPGNTIEDKGSIITYTFDSTNPFSRHNYLNGHHYVTLYETGLCEIVGDTILPVKNGEGISGYLPFEILPYDEDKLLLPSFKENDIEWLLFDGEKTTRFSGAVVKYAENLSSIHCSYLKDNLYALSTEIGGMILFNEKGDILNVFDREFGLPDEVAHVPLLDSQDGLWIPMDYGVARVRLNSALSHYGYKQGLTGSVSSMIRFKDTLILATNSGLLRLIPNDQPQKLGSFELIDDMTLWCWDLEVVNDQLLISTYEGIFKLDDPQGKAQLISEAWSEPLTPTHNGKRIYYGSYFDGIGSLKNLGNGKWEDEGYVEGTEDEIYEIISENDSTLWLAVGGRSLERITLTEDLSKPPKLLDRRIYKAEDGLPYVEMQFPFIYKEQLLTGNILGLSRYDETDDRFYPDSTVSFCIPKAYEGFINPHIDPKGRIWFESNNESGVCAEPQLNGTYIINHFLSQGISTSFSSYLFDESGIVWAGGSGGLLIRYDESLVEPTSNKIQTVIQRVLVNGEQLYSHLSPTRKTQVVLPYSENSIRIEYSIPEYNFSSQNQYSYQLVGLHKQAIPWTDETYRDFDELREGAYVFEVRGKNIYEQISPVSSFSFRILPPWYRTPLAYLSYLVIFVSFLYFYVRTRTKRIEKINKKLESLVIERTHDLEKTVDDLHKEIIERERAESERKKMEEQLYHAQKMETIGRITGGIAHDFNNMLAIIKGHADLALLTINPETPGYKEFDLILNTAEKAGNLSHQLLAYSRKQALIPTTIDLNEIVTDIHKMMDMSMFENINIVIKCGGNLWKTNADRSQMEQSVFNLAINARDAMPDGGELKIETANFVVDENYHHDHPYIPIGNFVRLSISDTGVGIPDEIRDNIFEPFFTTKEQGKGTGLGLSSVYGTVKQSNGFLEVVSEMGLGTTFHILLPRIAKD